MTPPRSQAIDRAPRLSRLVRDRLAERIYQRDLVPGDALPSESALAREYDVSKSVIREALSELAALQVIEIQQGRPTTIRAVSAAPLATLFDLAVCAGEAGLHDMLELRLAIECQAAAAAAERRTPAQLATLAALVEDLRAHLHDAEGWSAANWHFHLTIMHAAGNPLFLLVFTALEKRIRDGQRLLFQQHEVRDPAQTLARHEDIHQAIAAADPVAATAAMRRHFALALRTATRLDAARA